ncbi:unnamed protein product [Rotaria sp. Silwood1]|nr:unnamed protein product [Rotaria sp. Silwood1]CAF1062470.1 unnamed protein product [Rotaria sp. Silwood1]CAF3429634.1 unnamed protein product [Rotaria sp. Silwood1]CAF4609114.1 unnamed protein product [Rotaria sp. Silwood1]
MSQRCLVEQCVRTARGLCDCCQQNLCLQHLNEHNALLISQLNPLADEINALGNRLQTLNIQKPISNSRLKLEQWRQHCYKTIDSYVEQKCQELDQLVHETVVKQRTEINRIQLKITELINRQETTRQNIDSLTSTIRQLETNINNIEQKCFTINTRPLVIDETLVSFWKTTDHELDLSTLWPVYKTITSPKGSCGSVTGNDRYLLKHQEPNLCLFDLEMNLVKQTLWSYGGIHDMCWSSTLDRFIVLGKNNIFLIDENTMSIDNVHTIEGRDWGSCTCSDTVLFASIIERASSIMEFRLLATIELIKEWKYPFTCTKNEFIADIIYSNENLALIVMNNSEKLVRIELRYVKTFDRIWSFETDIKWIQNKIFRCCSLPCNEWLIVDYEAGCLLHITKDGKMKKIIRYYPAPYRATLFDLNKLAVSTMEDVRLHTIQ